MRQLLSFSLLDTVDINLMGLRLSLIEIKDKLNLRIVVFLKNIKKYLADKQDIYYLDILA